jgi:hypothetical protein
MPAVKFIERLDLEQKCRVSRWKPTKYFAGSGLKIYPTDWQNFADQFYLTPEVPRYLSRWPVEYP